MPLLIKRFCDGSELYLTVEIGVTTVGSSYGVWNTAIWDTSLWGFSETFTDVSAYVESISSSRKFGRQLRVWSAGSVRVVLNNQDGRFSPDNLAGPYVVAGLSGIRPGCGIRVKLTYRGVDYGICKGYVDEWAEEWEEIEGSRTGTATTVVSATDEWPRISAAPGVTVSPVGAGETFGARINRLLNATGSTAPRAIDAGSSTMLSTDMSSDPVQEIETTCDSEGGSILVDEFGTVVGKRKYALVEDTRSTIVQVTFGDGGGIEIPWESISTAPLNTSGLINSAAYTRVGGIQQVYSDVGSQALYGIRGDKSPNVGELVCDSDAQALSLAQWAVLSHKDPETLVTDLTVLPHCFVDDFATLIGLKILDLAKVIRRPPSATSHTVTRYCFINGIDIEIANGDVRQKLYFASASKYYEFSTSKWDVGLWDSARWFT